MKSFLSLICSICLIGCSYESNEFKILQPKSDSPNFFEFNEFQIRQKVLYVPATTRTVKRGYLLMGPILRLPPWKMGLSRCGRIIARGDTGGPGKTH